MDVEILGRALSTLPAGDDHPYRSGPWRPQTVERAATDLDVVGEIPADLDGVYLRNTENPVHPAMAAYHPFDGDGMVHVVGFRDGKAFYRNRFVRTDGFVAEQSAGRSLWAGIAELDPLTLDTLGKSTWDGWFPDRGVSAHTKVDPATGELLFFNYGKEKPYLNYGVVDADDRLVHYGEVELPGPRLPHDLAFTENYTILDGFFQSDPEGRDATFPGDQRYARMFRMLSLDGMRTRLHRRRLNLATGRVAEERATDTITEFGMVNPRNAGRPYRYTYASTGEPGWFLFDGFVKHDLVTGREERYRYGAGVFGSETAFAARTGSQGEDDGYLITMTTDMNADRSECLVFDAARVADGPLARIRLPERVCSGTHSTWAPGAALPGWRDAEDPAGAVGLAEA